MSVTGANAVRRLQFGMVRQPWFIGTVIGTVGGALWFALCVFSLWLCRRRQRRRKYPRSNGVVSGTLLISVVGLRSFFPHFLTARAGFFGFTMLKE